MSSFLFLSLLSLSSSSSISIPSFPVLHSPSSSSSPSNLTCHLDLSAELFGGVSSSCSSPLDRARCCPVLAAWLFAAHSRSALQLPSPSSTHSSDSNDILPIVPDDSQRCVDALQASLDARRIRLPRPNATCDTVICFCGIRLHQIGSLTCPKAFNLTAAAGSNRTSYSAAAPTAELRELERDCRNSSYAGCTRCLQSLDKVKGGKRQEEGTTDRAARMFSRDCQLMGLTWLLTRNKTLYIPTVSAVLRAILYSPTHQSPPYTCSPDHENMPLAVDSLQFEKTDSSTSSSSSVSALASSGCSVFFVLLVFVWLV